MSLVYLDTVIPIYFIEGIGTFPLRAESALQTIWVAGDSTALSELTKLECRVGPLRTGNAKRLSDFEDFFTAQILLPLTVAVYERAAHIRATYNFKVPDAIHLAAAVEAGCDRFLTNDYRLARFQDIAVEILP